MLLAQDAQPPEFLGVDVKLPGARLQRHQHTVQQEAEQRRLHGDHFLQSSQQLLPRFPGRDARLGRDGWQFIHHRLAVAHRLCLGLARPQSPPGRAGAGCLCDLRKGINGSC